jgi:hypothetical protein
MLDKPSPASKAGRAYAQGKKTAESGGNENENPYLLSSVIHLSNWWIKGFDDAKQNESE